jgi:hypothetical protein
MLYIGMALPDVAFVPKEYLYQSIRIAGTRAAGRTAS